MVQAVQADSIDTPSDQGLHFVCRQHEEAVRARHIFAYVAILLNVCQHSRMRCRVVSGQFLLLLPASPPQPYVAITLRAYRGMD